MRDLNDMIQRSGFVLTRATSINSRGQIVAIGRDDDGSGHHRHEQTAVRVFVLTPVP
jgi:hypothetical protein